MRKCLLLERKMKKKKCAVKFQLLFCTLKKNALFHCFVKVFQLLRPFWLSTVLLSFGKYEKHIQGHQIDLEVRGFVEKVLSFDKKVKNRKVRTYGEGKPHRTVVATHPCKFWATKIFLT